MSDSRLTGRHSSLLTALAVSAIVAVVAACGGSAATATPVASVAPSSAATAAPPPYGRAPDPNTPVQGGEMTLAVSSDPTTWDPCVIASTTPATQADTFSTVYGNLIVTNSKGVVEPAMAQSLTSTDGITWTLKLRPGLKFSDGTPFDADAVNYNWTRMADVANACTSQKQAATWTLTTVDATTLTIKLQSANANWALQAAELWPYIASPTALKAATKKGDIKPAGAGPFLMQNWNQGVSTVYVRNPNYWDAPRPYLDKITFKVVADTNTRINLVVSGAAMNMTGYPWQWGSLSSSQGVTAKIIPIPGYNYLYFNTKSASTSDVRARKAIVEAISGAALIQALTTNSTLTAPVTMFPEGSPYYDATVKWPTQNATDAAALFAALKAEGKSLNFKVAGANNSDTNRAVAYIQQVLTAYPGVTVTVNSFPLANLATIQTSTHDFDILTTSGIVVWNGPEPQTYNTLHSGLSSNYAQLNSPAMDAALDATLTALTPEAKKAAYVAVQKQVMTDLPYWAYGAQNRWQLIRTNLGGITHVGQGQMALQYLFMCPGPCIPYES